MLANRSRMINPGGCPLYSPPEPGYIEIVPIGGGTWSSAESFTSRPYTADVGDVGGATSLNIALWFEGIDVTIPKGVTISTAYLTFCSAIYKTGDLVARFIGADVDNPNEPTNANECSSPTRTSASVPFEVSAAWANGYVYEPPESAELKSIIQEIIDRPGWASENNMVLYIENVSSGANITRRLRAWGHWPPIRLYAEWP